MTFPAFDVWIHERHIHKILRLSPSATHGQYHALSCIITTITTGKGGNKQQNTQLTVDSNYAHCTFDVSPRNVHQVAFQPYGRHESFDAGTLNATVQMVLYGVQSQISTKNIHKIWWYYRAWVREYVQKILVKKMTGKVLFWRKTF